MSEHSGVTGKTPMAGTQKAIAMFGSAAALAFAVGFTGVGVSSLGSTTAPTPPLRPDEWLAH